MEYCSVGFRDGKIIVDEQRHGQTQKKISTVDWSPLAKIGPARDLDFGVHAAETRQYQGFTEIAAWAPKPSQEVGFWTGTLASR